MECEEGNYFNSSRLKPGAIEYSIRELLKTITGNYRNKSFNSLPFR